MIYTDGVERQIKRDEAWRLQYRRERYLRGLANSELFARAGHAMTSVLQHSKDGKMGVIPKGEDSSKGDLALSPSDVSCSLLERLTHVLEELVIRGIDYQQPQIVEAMQAPRPNSPKVKRALQVLARNSWPDPILVKFGERKHMASLFLEGKGRISLATTYNDPSLGNARADDESQIDVYVHPTDAHRLMAVEHDANGSRGMNVDAPYLGSLQVNLRATSDYYVYCMAESCDARMFDDFSTTTSDVDTCVIITRPDEFKGRIREAIASKLPEWKLLDASVTYVDPFFGRVHQLTPQFCKHFRFEYQEEYRLLWLPPDPEHPTKPAPPDHVYFDLGSLTDCARLIWL